MQAFYWDCPSHENKEYNWWSFVEAKISSLKKIGFTALWLPPCNKAANISGPSMGYDPYDFYDLGDHDQKGSIKTWFGSRQELLSLIKKIHAHGMEVYADVVFNHCSGADEQEQNPYAEELELEAHKVGWTKYTPKSGKFPRDWKSFHPSRYETWDDYVFSGMPDLCHRNPEVYTEILNYCRWLLEDIGFDGFRYDCSRGYGAWMARAIQELRTLKNNKMKKPFGVGEFWMGHHEISAWLTEANAWTDNPVSAFDFPLRDKLKSLCDAYGFNLHELIAGGSLLTSDPVHAATFVENHDIVRDHPIGNDKMLAYAFILTHEGYPCVFWQDYYNWNLAQEGLTSGIDALVKVHESNAGGGTEVLHIDDNLYIMQRSGYGAQKGLIFVLNNRGDGWNGTWVKSSWSHTTFIPKAWRGNGDMNTPLEVRIQESGWGEFWAPPRGYAVYVPEQ